MPTKTRNQSAPVAPVLDVDTAAALVAQREAEHSDAVSAASALRSRLRAGDDTVTTADLTEADTVSERAALLLDAARSALADAEAAVPFVPSVALAVAAALADGLSFPVLATQDVPAVHDMLPTLYVSQPSPAGSDPHSGYVSGSVVLTYARSRLHSRLDPDHIRNVLAARQVAQPMTNAATRTTEADGLVLLDVVTLPITSAYEPVPTIRGNRPQPFRLSHLARMVAGEIGAPDRLDRTEAGVTVGAGDASRVVSSLTTYGESARVERVAVEGDERVVTAEVALTITPRGDGYRAWSADDIRHRVVAVLDAHVGRVASGLGRCRGASLVRVGPGGAPRSLDIVTRLTYISRQG